MHLRSASTAESLANHPQSRPQTARQSAAGDDVDGDGVVTSVNAVLCTPLAKPIRSSIKVTSVFVLRPIDDGDDDVGAGGWSFGIERSCGTAHRQISASGAEFKWRNQCNAILDTVLK